VFVLTMLCQAKEKSTPIEEGEQICFYKTYSKSETNGNDQREHPYQVNSYYLGGVGGGWGGGGGVGWCGGRLEAPNFSRSDSKSQRIIRKGSERWKGRTRKGYCRWIRIMQQEKQQKEGNLSKWEGLSIVIRRRKKAGIEIRGERLVKCWKKTASNLRSRDPYDWKEMEEEIRDNHLNWPAFAATYVAKSVLGGEGRGN